MKQFYKSKSFIILVSIALVAVIVPSVFFYTGNGATVKTFFNTIFSPMQKVVFDLTVKSEDLLEYFKNVKSIN